MQIKKLLEIENIIEGRAIPCDMLDDSLNAHYSKSRRVEIKILDMHLPHLVRAYSNMIDYDKEWHDKSYNEGWNDALESLKK